MYLAEEYKDTPSSLNYTLQNTKTQQTLLIKLLKFYLAERMSCVNCLFYILSHLKNEDHPLYNALKSEISEMNKSSDVRSGLLAQLKTLLSPEFFNVTSEDENIMSGHSIKSIFTTQLKKEIVALLKTLLVYNHHFPHTPESYLTQSKLIFCHLISFESTLISGLSVMLTLDGLDIEYIFEHFDKVRLFSYSIMTYIYNIYNIYIIYMYISDNDNCYLLATWKQEQEMLI